MPQDDCTMEIIGIDNNLDNLLRDVKNLRVDIAVAFATKTEKVIDALIVNGNEVFLTVGTMNCFSDPVFFRHCQELAQENPKLNLAVDFRYDDSIHWKVYLIYPNIVVIGSANLTRTGLSMMRDTMVKIEDKVLYDHYLKLFQQLRSNHQVVACNNPSFNDLLDNYEKQHHTIPPKPKLQNGQVSSFTEWFSRDESQFLPLFIWKRYFNEPEKEEFDTKVTNILTDNNIGAQFSPLGLLERKPPRYYQGQIVLMMRNTGASIEFKLTRFISHNKRWWLYGINRSKYEKPFVLTNELKRAIRDFAPQWYEEGKTFLDTNDLQELADKVLANQ